MYTLAIDPGLSTGWALFLGTQLVQCGLGPPPFGFAMGPGLDRTAIERPEVYTEKRLQKGDPNNLITLAIMVGVYICKSVTKDIYTPLPKTWKGQVPKEIHNRRVLSALTPFEKDIYAVGVVNVAPSERNNVIDAIGLGQWLCKATDVQLTQCRYQGIR